MLNISELSDKTKQRIITILDEDGVHVDSVQACVMGVASENGGYTDPVEALKNISTITQDAIKNNKDYTRQVLTVYGRKYAERTTATMFAILGIDPLSPQGVEILIKSDEVLTDHVEKWIPKVSLPA